jgi:putative membrane protein
MNNVSNLQQQYPLEAGKKFWKKMLEQTLLFLIISIFIGPFIGIAFSFFVSGGLNMTSNTSLIISGVSSFILTLILSIGIYSWYIKEYIKTYYYSADTDFITIKKHVFTPTEIHVQYKKIQDVYVDQDLLDRILGLYDVHIASATVSSGIEAHIDGVSQKSAEGLKNLLLESIKGSGSLAQTPNISNPGSNVQPPVAINLSESISEKTYPILNRWLWAKVLGSIVGVSFFWLIVSFYFFTGKSGHPSLSQDLGWSFNSNYIFVYLAVVFVSSLIQTIYLIIWKKSYKFEFTPEYIFTHQGVISLQEKHVPYNTVQDVIMNQSFIDRLLGLYNVTIQNATNNGMAMQSKNIPVGFSGVIIPGQSFERATKLTEMLKTTVLSKNSNNTGL